MLNFRQRCSLCNQAIDTPHHLFENCEKGRLLREKRDYLIMSYNFENINLTENKKVYSYFNKSYNRNRVIQYIITVANFSIYREKMKNFYDQTYTATNESAMFTFLNKIKLRIFYDKRRLNIEEFKVIWDPNEHQNLFLYNDDNIISWNF